LRAQLPRQLDALARVVDPDHAACIAPVETQREQGAAVAGAQVQHRRSIAPVSNPCSAQGGWNVVWRQRERRRRQECECLCRRADVVEPRVEF